MAPEVNVEGFKLLPGQRVVPLGRRDDTGEGIELLLDSQGRVIFSTTVPIVLDPGDIEIGAVELKDAATDTRAKIAALIDITSAHNGVPVTDPIAVAKQELIHALLSTIDGHVDGLDAVLGITSGAAIVSDIDGTIQRYLRGLVKIDADVWDSVNHAIKVWQTNGLNSQDDTVTVYGKSYGGAVGDAVLILGSLADTLAAINNLGMVSARTHLQTGTIGQSAPWVNISALGANGFNGLNVPPTVPVLYNASGYDVARGNLSVVGLSSAARTATMATVDQLNISGRGVRVILKVTSGGGAGGLTVRIEHKDAGSNYIQLNDTPTPVTAAGTYVYDVYPSTMSAVGTGGGRTQLTSSPVGRTWRANVVAADTTSYSYSVGLETLL